MHYLQIQNQQQIYGKQIQFMIFIYLILRSFKTFLGAAGALEPDWRRPTWR